MPTGTPRRWPACSSSPSADPDTLGRRSAVTDDGDELTIVFFTDDEALRAWHDDPEHRAAQHLARERWYERYQVHVARVERTYRFQR